MLYNRIERRRKRPGFFWSIARVVLPVLAYIGILAWNVGILACLLKLIAYLLGHTLSWKVAIAFGLIIGLAKGLLK